MLKFAAVLLLFAGLLAAGDGADVVSNPVIARNSPDPGALQIEEGTIVVTTSGDDADRFPIHFTPDEGRTWELSGYVFPSSCTGRQCPQWGKIDFWAPEMHRVNGMYLVYYTARGTDGVLAIGVASSQNWTGPFEDTAQPLVHDSDMGNIDATFFQDVDGAQYLIWKVDGNAVGKPTPIYQQQLTQGGLGFAAGSQRIVILTDDQPWEYNLVEGPWLLRFNHTYFLFYSGAGYASATYAVGVARSSSVHGPFEKKMDGPILHTENVAAPLFSGPGHCSVLMSTKNESNPVGIMYYHAWDGSRIAQSYPRSMLMDQVVFHDNWPSVGNSSVPSASFIPVPL